MVDDLTREVSKYRRVEEEKMQQRNNKGRVLLWCTLLRRRLLEDARNAQVTSECQQLNYPQSCLEAVFDSEYMSTIVSAFIDAGTLRGDQRRYISSTTVK
jgi:hypothetical protein